MPAVASSYAVDVDGRRTPRVVSKPLGSESVSCQREDRRSGRPQRVLWRPERITIGIHGATLPALV
jgi:hypothetical protein